MTEKEEMVRTFSQFINHLEGLIDLNRVISIKLDMENNLIAIRGICKNLEEWKRISLDLENKMREIGPSELIGRVLITCKFLDWTSYYDTIL